MLAADRHLPHIHDKQRDNFGFVLFCFAIPIDYSLRLANDMMIPRANKALAFKCPLLEALCEPTAAARSVDRAKFVRLRPFELACQF